MILNRIFGLFIIAFGFIGHLSIRFGERAMAFISMQKADWHNRPANQASIVAPAQAAPSMLAIVPRSMPMVSPITLETPMFQPPSASNQAKPATSVPDAEQVEMDDLDWAGSLSHAAVASQHLSNLLAMVRAGWIVVEHERLKDVSPALDAIEVFQNRTALALAPLLEQMTEAQHAEFFSDFDADFPPNLDLEGIE